jgi:hypothetical protein
LVPQINSRKHTILKNAYGGSWSSFEEHIWKWFSMQASKQILICCKNFKSSKF